MGNEQARYYDSDDDDDSDDMHHGAYPYDSDSDSDIDDLHSIAHEPPRKMQKTTDSGEIEIQKPPEGINGLMPFLTIDLIRQYTSASTFEQAYVNVVERKLPTGDIVSLDDLRLKYSSRDTSSKTVIHLRPLGGIEKAECDCMIRGPLWCRHVVQALLTVLYEPGSVIRNETMAKAMEVAEKAFLHELLMQHCTVHPEFAVTLSQTLKEKFPQIFLIEPPKDYVPPPSTAFFSPPKEGADPKRIVLTPLKRTSMTAENPSERRTDWRPEFLIDPEKFMERSGQSPKLDAKRFGTCIREFTVDYGNRTYYGPGSTCPHYCYQYQVNQNCSHSTGTLKVGNAPQLNELFDAIDLLWQNGDIVNALEAMVSMTTGLSEATHRLHRSYNGKSVGLYMIATRLADKWCRIILSCPKSVLQEASVRDAIENYLAHISMDREDPTEPIFRGALLCLEHHWSNPALVKLLDAAFGIESAAADANADAMSVDPLPTATADDDEDNNKPSTRKTKSKKRKRTAEPATPKAASKSKAAMSDAYDEPLVAVAARLRFFAEVGNRTAWNALARWVIASIGAGKSAPSVQDCKIIADALVAHSALGALAFLSGPVRKYSNSHSTALTFSEISEICELLVSVAGKCCTPELKQRRSAPLSSLVVRCATLVAPHLWDSLEDSDQVTNLLDYPPEITDLVTLELAIQAISSLASRGEFNIAHMVWKLIPRIESECDIIAASDAALAAFPFAILDSTNSNASAPVEIRGRSISNWDKECCMTLLDYCYTALPIPKRRAAITKAVDAIIACGKLSAPEVHSVMRKLIEFYNKLSDTQVVKLDLVEPAPPKPVEESPAPKGRTKKTGKASAAAAAAAASAASSSSALSAPVTTSSFEVHMCDLIWKLGSHGLTRKSPASTRTSSYYYDVPPMENETKLKTDLFNDICKFVATIPVLRLAQTSIPQDDKARRRELGKAAMASDCDDISEMLLNIASSLPFEEPDTIRMAARSFELAAKLASRTASERRYAGAMQQEFEENSSKQAQGEALRWLEKAIKLPPKDRDPELIVSLLKGVYSIVPDVDTFQRIENLIMPPETLALLRLTADHKLTIRQSLIETLKDALGSNSQPKCERAAVLCIHLGLLPDSVAPLVNVYSGPYGGSAILKADISSALPRLLDFIATKGKNQYWFDLLIERTMANSENTTQAVRLHNAARILLDKGRWDLSVKIQGEAILSQARVLSSQSSDYTKFANQLEQFKNSCIDANAVDKFQEVYNAVITTQNVARKPKLVNMLVGKDSNIKGTANTKAKNALEKAVKAARVVGVGRTIKTRIIDQIVQRELLLLERLCEIADTGKGR
eukprot:TRINITY_DN5994_c0_g1_i2.p1 TRINITY_DN5994_c0_g1~~TRINITY_DN5994_c0_g1_i2.p1  ORF type:complete len:1338 (-),score=275.69 TRINITY_DN5994_c0_g1_i2:381-4394(-)